MKSYVTYLVEAFLLACFLIIEIQFIDAYLKYRQLKSEYQVKSLLNEYATELSLETVGAIHGTTLHYDRHAQKQLKFEREIKNLNQLSGDYGSLGQEMSNYLSQVVEYMQLATMLKTSFRFITSMELPQENVNTVVYGELAELLSLIAHYKTDENDKIKSKLQRRLSSIKPVLSRLEKKDFRWKMFFLHTRFILENYLRSNDLLHAIQTTQVNSVISQEIIMTNHAIEQVSWKMILLAIFGTVAFLSLLIAALVRQAAHLQIANKAAQIAVETKSQFLANMSHEIRTPMNGIVGLSDILMRTGLNQQQMSYMEKLKFSALSLTIIINDILDFSKIEAKNLHIETISFDLFKVLDNVKIMMGRSAYEKELELIFDIDTKVHHHYIGDPVRIGQVLTNLASNAVKFTHKGHVKIMVSCERSEGDKDIIRFIVEDTGIGISDENKSKLFNRFAQAESSTSRKYGGTGLGLAISKMLIELMQGKISFESTEGKGSVFEFALALPRCDVSENRKFDLKSAKAKFNQRSALIVEDNVLTQAITKNMLDKLGFICEVAGDGMATIELLKKNQYDLLLLDWKLPDLTGVELVEQIEKHKSHFKELIIFTGFDTDYLNTELPYPVLNKPVMLPELFEFLSQQGATNEQYQKQLRNQPPENPLGLSVLLVEDNEINAMIALDVLHDLGIQVECAVNGIQAIQKVESKQFDMIIMDIQMPAMDGMEATKKIREIYSKDELPIIALTANVMPEEIDIYLSLGMNDHIGKPFERDELEYVIHKLNIKNRK